MDGIDRSARIERWRHERQCTAGVDPVTGRSTLGKGAAVKYMLLIYLDEGWERRSLAERQRIYEAQVKHTEELAAKGQYLAGNPLHPPASATTVRVRDGKRLLTDGPFAETREHLGGYMLIDVANLDEAIAFASRAPLAREATIEVRPVRDGMPV
jgi:hypothetical protein